MILPGCKGMCQMFVAQKKTDMADLHTPLSALLNYCGAFQRQLLTADISLCSYDIWPVEQT